jgi:hypothetical protein
MLSIALDLHGVTGENKKRKLRKGVLGISPRGAVLMVGPPSDIKPSDAALFIL